VSHGYRALICASHHTRIITFLASRQSFVADLSIITMWLAVLFVGIFGGDFVRSSSSGFTNIPVVIFSLPFVLPATIVVGRRGFASAADEPHGAPDEETQARQEATTEPSALRARPA
jgi:hypothetical protein